MEINKIKNPSIIIYIIKKIDVDHLFIETHKVLYRSLITIYQKQNIDPVKLAYSLKPY